MKYGFMALFVSCGLLAIAGRPAGAESQFSTSVTNLMENYSHYVPKGTLQMFNNERDGQLHCEQDPVVWVDTDMHVSYTAGEPQYGRTPRGGYVCEHEAINAGDRIIPAAQTGTNAPQS